jgi:hypothetical protein
MQTMRAFVRNRGAGTPIVLVFESKQYTKFGEPVPISHKCEDLSRGVYLLGLESSSDHARMEQGIERFDCFDFTQDRPSGELHEVSRFGARDEYSPLGCRDFEGIGRRLI